MTGTVHFLEARLLFGARGPKGRAIQVDAVIDTRFTGWLTLPRATIDVLGLEYRGPGRAKLADGSIIVFKVYEARIIWNRRVRRIFIDEGESTPLVGMSLLSGCEFRVDACPGGKVSNKPLPGNRGEQP
jgi:clan AA aspartic protease